MTRSIIIIFSALFFSLTLQGQSLRAYESAAAKALAVKDYTAALGYYKIILEDAGDTKIENYYKAAEAARMARDYHYAESYYAYVVANRNGNEFSDAEYWLATSQKYLGKYNDAQKNFELYAGRKSGSKKGLTKSATTEAEVAKWASEVVTQKDDTEIIHLDDKINSGFADFSPFIMDDQLYYSSIRLFGQDIAEGKPYAKIMTSENKSMGVSLKGNVNIDLQHVSNPSLSETGQRLYYTICDEKEPLVRRCDIYYRDRNGDDWDQPVKLPETINAKNANNTQPYEGLDLKGQRTLFFASNRSGGKGGMDLYQSVINSSGEFGQVENLQTINTESNEVTPYYHKRSSTLYFSTDGYKSLGGLDIYKSKMNKGNWNAAEHTGYPLNSSYDDAYLRMNERGDLGYFSSNRPGNYCLDTTITCVCPDIYETARPVVDLIVRTYNAITKEPLMGTEVNLIPKLYDSESQVDLDNNEYYFGLDFDNDYDIKGLKEGYTYDTELTSTHGDRTSRTIEKDLYLRPNVDLTALVFNKSTGEPLNGVTVELHIIGEDGAVERKIELDKNNFDFPLDWLKRYRVVATKKGYSTASVEVATEGIPVIPTSLTENLFLCRQPFAEYPFLAMYFDNDFPKPERGLVANTDYESTYKNYSTEEKRAEFTELFSSEEEKNKVLDFFNEVDEGYSRLQTFASNLTRLYVDELSRDTVIVTIKGFASPRSYNAYNKDLTERRINSMEQYLAKYDGGVLADALKDGRIFIKRESNGEELAKGGSEDFNNRKESVYAIEASQERRVEIIRITRNKYVCPEPQSK